MTATPRLYKECRSGQGQGERLRALLHGRCLHFMARSSSIQFSYAAVQSPHRLQGVGAHRQRERHPAGGEEPWRMWTVGPMPTDRQSLWGVINVAWSKLLKGDDGRLANATPADALRRGFRLQIGADDVPNSSKIWPACCLSSRKNITRERACRPSAAAGECAGHATLMAPWMPASAMSCCTGSGGVCRTLPNAACCAMAAA